MNLGPGQLEAWQELYAAAGRVSDLGPWKWMSEMDVFGIQVPSTAELVFASVMGELGEHYAVAAYRGASALYSFLAMTVDQDSPPVRQLRHPSLTASMPYREISSALAISPSVPYLVGVLAINRPAQAGPRSQLKLCSS